MRSTSGTGNDYFYGGFGIFILLIAGINFMNLSTARSLRRAKEVGVRKDWLNGFEYRVAFSWWHFLMAGFGILAITVLTASYQTLKAALVNPVESLKNE